MRIRHLCVVSAIAFAALACGDGGSHDSLVIVTTTTPGGSSTTTTLGGPTTTNGGGNGSSSTSSTVGGSTSTTTTTLPHDTCPGGNHPACNGTFRVTNTVKLGSLQFDVDYSALNGCFKGIGVDVECHLPVGIDAIATYNDDDAHKTLRAALASVNGVNAPANVAVCKFIGATTPPNPANFPINVVEALDTNLVPVTANVALTFNCSANTTTTLGSTTTTTMENAFDVTIRLDDPVTVGGLQFAVDYSSAPGEFRGSGAGVDQGGTLECTSLAPSTALAQFNDDDAGTLRMAYISTSGIQGPLDVARCVFVRDGAGGLTPGAFTINVEDAVTTDNNPIVPLPAVIISSIVQR